MASRIHMSWNSKGYRMPQLAVGHGPPRFCHVTLLLFNLHWLPISYCIMFKILFLTFQCLYGQAPTYLIDLITIKKQSRYSLRTSESIYFLSYLALRPVPPLAIVHSSQLHLISGSITFGNLQHKDIGHF